MEQLPNLYIHEPILDEHHLQQGDDLGGSFREKTAAFVITAGAKLDDWFLQRSV